MKRTRSIVKVGDPTSTNFVRFKKIGGGSLRIGGRIIKRNEVFEADPDTIPKLFMNTLIPLDAMPVKKDEEVEEKDVDLGYSLHHRGGPWWDVIDKQGKAINERAMRIKEAEDLLKSL